MNTAAKEGTAPDRDATGRFTPGNAAARRHGLRAGTKRELQRRDARTGRLFTKYLTMRAEQGRAIGETQVPLARRYCELAILAQDHYALVLDKPANTRAMQTYLAIVRVQATVAAQLGETASTAKLTASEARELKRQKALEAQRRIRDSLGAAPSGRVGGSELTALSPHFAEAEA